MKITNKHIILTFLTIFIFLIVNISAIFPKLNFQLNLQNLCKDFQDAEKFKERIGQELSDQQKIPYFTYEQIINLFDCYIEQIKQIFNDIDFEKSSATSQYTFLNKQMTQQDTNILSMGDFHGSVHSLLRNFYQFYIDKNLDENFKIHDMTKIICTGDYIDRGNFGIETLCFLLYLKLKNWDKVILIRGNHEDPMVNFYYGFYAEIKQKYPKDFQKNLDKLEFIFNSFPSALWLEIPDKQRILFTHGGFDPLTLEKVKTNLLENTKNYALIISEKNDEYINESINFNKYAWYDFGIINHQICMFERSWNNSKQIKDAMQILKKYNTVAIIRGHQHYSPGFKMLTLKANGIPMDWRTIPNLKMPISLKQEVPIFTLSTATEICSPDLRNPGIFTGPTRSSYVKIKIGETFEQCTIEPIETSKDLTNPKNLNKIIPQIASIKADEETAAFVLANVEMLANNPETQIPSLYANEILDDEGFSENAHLKQDQEYNKGKRGYEKTESSYSDSSSEPDKKRKLNE